MKTYRVTLTLRAPAASAWQADTIFGHLCWLLTWRYGEAAFKQWLELYQQQTPPLLLSDGFPGELLPRPVPPPPPDKEEHKAEGMKNADARKKLKGIEWLTLAEFDAIRQGQPFAASAEGDKIREQLGLPRVTFKNQISRLTGTTGEEGNLYPFVEEVFWKPLEQSETLTFQNKITIYLRIADQDFPVADSDGKTKILSMETLVRQLFDDLVATGYGKRKSVGYGEIEQCEWLSFNCGFAPIADANAFVSLSHFVPAKDDPREGQWRVNVKYGKLGGEFALPNPFKHPLIMLMPGSWFATLTPDKAWYGRLVPDIVHDRPDIVQYGYAFALPMKIAVSKGECDV